VPRKGWEVRQSQVGKKGGHIGRFAGHSEAINEKKTQKNTKRGGIKRSPSRLIEKFNSGGTQRCTEQLKKETKKKRKSNTGYSNQKLEK